jgi:hypothetical protein
MQFGSEKSSMCEEKGFQKCAHLVTSGNHVTKQLVESAVFVFLHHVLIQPWLDVMA